MALVCYVFDKVNEVDIAVQSLTTRVSSLETTSTSHTNKIDNLQNQITDLQSRIEKLEATPSPTPSSSLNACIQPPQGIISWWPGDGNANDIRGGNNGTVQGASFSSGEVGQAFSFDWNSFIQAGTTNLPIGNNDRTLELWVKINQFLDDAPNPSDPLEAFFAGYGNYGFNFQIYNLGTTGNLLMFSQWGSAIWGPSLKTETWYHIAVTSQGNNETLYLNGLPIGNGTLPINTPSNTQFYIGRIPGVYRGY